VVRESRASRREKSRRPRRRLRPAMGSPRYGATCWPRGDLPHTRRMANRCVMITGHSPTASACLWLVGPSLFIFDRHGRTEGVVFLVDVILGAPCCCLACYPSLASPTPPHPPTLRAAQPDPDAPPQPPQASHCVFELVHRSTLKPIKNATTGKSEFRFLYCITLLYFVFTCAKRANKCSSAAARDHGILCASC